SSSETVPCQQSKGIAFHVRSGNRFPLPHRGTPVGPLTGWPGAPPRVQPLLPAKAKCRGGDTSPPERVPCLGGRECPRPGSRAPALHYETGTRCRPAGASLIWQQPHLPLEGLHPSPSNLWHDRAALEDTGYTGELGLLGRL